ncbi:MAG: class I SAM-dependent methyltransferase [Marinirhabdus sp.]
MAPCPICEYPKTVLFYNTNAHRFLQCKNCGTVFRDPKGYLSAKAEKARYLTHNNDVEAIGYQNFVKPIVRAVQCGFENWAQGLDFGAGTGPVITKLLSEKGYNMTLYDPFFYPGTSVLSKKYDFIVCCEVIEHFYRPLKEFGTLRDLLRPHGKLYCMTDPLTPSVNFEKWYYKNDPTHVVFYTEKNVLAIKEKIGFSKVEMNGRLIVFSR